MFKTALIAAALSLPLPAVASEWMGSFYGAGGGYDGNYTATWKNGKIKGDITGVFLGQTFQPAALPFGGSYSVKNGRMKGNIDFAGKFVGYRGKGQMQGVFKDGGRFDGTKTGKSKSKR